MKRISLLIVCSILLLSCSDKALVEANFVDSLLQHYTPSVAATTAEQDLDFWKQRADSIPDMINKQKYASTLVARFHTYGDINDLVIADSIFKTINHFYKGKETGLLLTRANVSMLKHRFKDAERYTDSAALTGAEKYAVQMTAFDAAFELGNAYKAASILKANKTPQDFAYNFRLSKMDHYAATLDSAIAHMQKAADIAASPYLKQAALSNLADLYVHKGKLKKAYSLYKQCIQFNRSDFHSLLGLGWIALVHDKNDTLAKKIFHFVDKQSKSPDALWRLIQANELNDSTVAQKYAVAFVQKVTQPVYGNMYNKYLIDLYTGILHQPEKALLIAQKEINNRQTAQTSAWLAWALAVNGRTKEAYQVYQQIVSGKPLEALELFWMGKLMQQLNKGYNAQQFFKAAAENQYDLSPKYQQELEAYLK
jgi:tetratricopeptide (TPR) repeat protein